MASYTRCGASRGRDSVSSGLQFRFTKVDHDVGAMGTVSSVAAASSASSHAVRLALHAVDQYAPDLVAVDAAALEHMPWRSFSLGGIGWRKDFVPYPTGWLQTTDPADGCMLDRGCPEC